MKSNKMIPKHVRALLFFQQRASIIFACIAMIIVIIALYFGFYGNVSLLTMLSNNSTFAGILGAMIGILGGGYISIQLQRWQTMIESVRRKRTTIYIPLYKNMLEALEFFKSGMLGSLRLDRKDFGTGLEWEKIKNDERILDLPGYVIHVFADLDAKYEAYLERLRLASEAITSCVESITVRRYNAKYNSTAIGSVLLSIFNANRSFDVDISVYKRYFRNYALFTDEQFKILEKQHADGYTVAHVEGIRQDDAELNSLIHEVHTRICDLREMKELFEAHNAISIYINEIILFLRDIIVRIDRLCGAQVGRL